LNFNFQRVIRLAVSLLLSSFIACSNLKIARLHQSILTIDTHCDTPLHMMREGWKIGERHEPGERGSGKVDLPRMKEGGLDAQFFAVFVGQGERNPEGYAKAQTRADKLLAKIHQMYDDYPDLVEFAATPEDAYRIEKLGKRAIYIGMENGYPIGKDLSMIEKYYDRGVRYITLCHTKNNDICDSSTDPNGAEHQGLSEFGRQVVAEMNRIGMIIDVSHISDEAFFDVLEVSQTPVIASHSCARALCDHPRNLTDEMLKALAQNGGVIQMCILSSFVKKIKQDPEKEAAREATFEKIREKYGKWDEIQDEKIRQAYRDEWHTVYETYPVEQATVQDVVDHIDHVVELIGIDHIGIGTDFDGGGGVIGCNDVSEMGNITRELVRRGYSDEDIRKVWSGNFMRVFRKVVATAEQLKLAH